MIIIIMYYYGTHTVAGAAVVKRPSSVGRDTQNAYT